MVSFVLVVTLVLIVTGAVAGAIAHFTAAADCVYRRPGGLAYALTVLGLLHTMPIAILWSHLVHDAAITFIVAWFVFIFILSATLTLRLLDRRHDDMRCPAERMHRIT